jgi:hypothetical protein
MTEIGLYHVVKLPGVDEAAVVARLADPGNVLRFTRATSGFETKVLKPDGSFGIYTWSVTVRLVGGSYAFDETLGALSEALKDLAIVVGLDRYADVTPPREE